MADKNECLIDHTYEIGDLVWAKMKWCKPWPGFVADSKGPKPKKRGNFKWIYFFGCDNYSWIDTKMIRPYVPISLDISRCSKLYHDAYAAIEFLYKNRKNSKFDPQNRDNTSFDKVVSKAPTKTPEPSTSKAKASNKKSPAAKKSTKERIQQVQDVSGKKRGENPRRGIVRKDSKKSDASEASSEKKIVKLKKRSSTSAVSEAKRVRTQHSDADTTTPFGRASCSNNGPAPTPRCTMTVNPLLDKPSLVCPESVQLKVSHKLLDKNIVPSDLQFGFIGLGNMGSGIVKNLLNSGHRVVIWNRTSKKTKKFINAGAKIAQTSQDVVRMADITFSCVSDIQAAIDIMFGNNSALDKINETKAYVEMSTIDSETSKLLSDAVTSRGGRYLEAQLQGSRLEAEEGNLVILSAGDQSLYNNCQSCFEAIGRTSFFFGEVGSATKMNLVIQLMSGVFLASCAEALALVGKLGLQHDDILEVLGLTKLSSPFIQEKMKSIIKFSFRPNHTLGLMQKDLDLVINMSKTVNQPVPLAAVTNERYKRAKILGYGDHDSSAVFVATRF